LKNRKLITLSLLAAPLLMPALAHAQSAQDPRNPKGIETPFNGTAEEAFIKDQIRGAGYSGVNSLIRDTDGAWHARAYKGPAEVLVAVDRSGHISDTAQR
jgi:hypothetical protein